ncbi:hypothetical protein M441DRAFT_152202 [Trichoderma asperellum CBS 433.97]|uniref:MYND-type zinc finger protein samB n=1 Tax=Trichoderma asperellum (strain ATCC 204424 / CBS 433.97 / NBRC 101777) TaxID=1042311 RepID=A0A2T3YU28_TRIA4|nr:hypothetical protein M441DRAFT_152202 [Trichoderma asperellum CBS 433.97]PTB36081.1 hypothetical protein M441DRAFT_152202 [Trichoderma asperellum CBS 433.97]
MREVNFSIPNVNKASVGITTALYDRRALDCTSTLPLINSLNHLAYLTTSSARIRDILTVDGGIERLVCILKEGRNGDMMSIWKWNLAFQCVVNIGVRGTENVRTRVVEADMVPVIATILDNYIKVIDSCREKSDELKQKQAHDHRRHKNHDHRHSKVSPSSNISRSSRDGDPRYAMRQESSSTDASEALAALRDVDRLTSISALGAVDLVTQPTSPTTPVPLLQLRPPTVRSATNLDITVSRSRRRPSIRHQNSTAESDDFNGDSMPSDEAPDTEMTGAAEIQSTVGIQDITMDDSEAILTGDTLDLNNPTASEAHQDAETFNIAHRTNLDGSIRDNMTHNPGAPVGLSPNRPALGVTPHPPTPSSTIPRYLLDRHLIPNPQLLSAMPREEDVLMSLQLLAYVSKYCCLRTYFQKSHLVPTLAIGDDLFDPDTEEEGEEGAPSTKDESESDDEYLLEDDFNLFPLVEKFTVRHHSTDMQYWAGVVMRNLCRKDDTRGGIRQCAYYQCGKWEEFTRQFAKCRRCRRTKYCSKDCQKSAWAFHRHWCVAAAQ